MSLKYLVDANVFIQARNLHYGFDFCPAFWDWLIAGNAGGVVGSIADVKNELIGSDDDLAQWARDHDKFFVNLDSKTAEAIPTVSQWIQDQSYEASAISTFSQGADIALIAYALAHGSTVVTHEVYADSAKRVKIPNVCVGVEVKCMNPYDMLRAEKARFVLGASQ